MGAVVVFNYGAWVASYPEFSSVSQEAATNYFNTATVFHDNTGVGLVANPVIQASLLNMLTSHIAAMFSQPNGKSSPANTLVGRLSNVSEGSISATAEYDAATGPSQAWFIQTKYGAMYWVATAPFRTMRYRAPRSGNLGLAQVPWLYPWSNS